MVEIYTQEYLNSLSVEDLKWLKEMDKSRNPDDPFCVLKIDWSK